MAFRLRVPFLVLLSALMAIARPAAGEDAKPKDFLKAPPSATAFELTESGVRIPLALDETVAATDLDPAVKVLDAALGAEHSPAFVTAFKPKVQDGAMVVDPPASTLRPGTYDLKLEVRLKATKGFKNSQALDLRLTVPAATLQAPGILVMERALGFNGYGDQEKRPVLFLKETSGHRGLAQVTIEQIGWQTNAKDAGDAQLAFISVPVPPGQTPRATVTLRNVDGLPLGTIQGLAEIRAPQLAAAVPFNVEVHTRRRLWWVPICVAVGLFCGWLLRTTLPNLVARDQARLLGIDLLDRIDRESGARKDPDFQAKLKEIRTALQTKIDDPKLSPDDLPKAITAATDSLNQEITALNGRLTAAQKEVDRLDKLVRTHWFVPEEMATALAAAKTDLGTARQALKDSDAKGASDAVAAALTRFADLSGQVQTWVVKAENLLDALADPERQVPAGLAEGLKASVEHVRGLLDAIPDPGTAPDADGLIQALDAVDKARRGARLILLRLAGGLETVLVAVQAALDGSPLLDLKAYSDAQEKAKQSIEELRAVEAPEDGTDEVVRALGGFDGDLRRGLLTQVSAEEGKQAVEEKLDQRLYGEAAREVARQLVATQPDDRARDFHVMVAAPQPGGVAPPGVTWQGIAGARQLFPQWDALPPVLNLAPGALGDARLRVASELWKITLLRTALVALGLLLLSLALYRDRIGTWNDVAEVFFWAFGTDVTVDAFWNAAKTLKKT